MALNDRLAIEENFRRQKTNIKWMKEGNQNTKFFHQAIKNRRQKLHIHKIKDGASRWLTKQKDIEAAAIDYFHFQLNGSHVSGGELLQHIPSIVSTEQNELLTDFPSMEEIHTTIKSMNGNSVIGPDGFNGFFLLYVETQSSRTFMQQPWSSLHGLSFQNPRQAL